MSSKEDVDDDRDPQFIALISNWNTAPMIPDGSFGLKVPATATEIEFVRIDVESVD